MTRKLAFLIILSSILFDWQDCLWGVPDKNYFFFVLYYWCSPRDNTVIHGDGVKRNEKLHKRYINDPSEKAKAGVTIFFSFLFFSFLFVLLFLFFSFLFFLFKKFFEVGQGEGSRFFSSGTALNLGGE